MYIYIWSSIHFRQPVADVRGSRPSASTRPGAIAPRPESEPTSRPQPAAEPAARKENGRLVGRTGGLWGGQGCPAPAPGQVGKHPRFPGAKQLRLTGEGGSPEGGDLRSRRRVQPGQAWFSLPLALQGHCFFP